MLGHEHTVGQDGAHDEHAEERDAVVKEAVGGADDNPHRGSSEEAIGGADDNPHRGSTEEAVGGAYPQIPQKAMG